MKTLLDLLALTSYWLTLTSQFNSFLLIYILWRVSGLPGKIRHVWFWQLHGVSPWLCFLPPRIQFCPLCLPKFCPIRPRQFFCSLTSTSNTQRGLPHQNSTQNTGCAGSVLRAVASAARLRSCSEILKYKEVLRGKRRELGHWDKTSSIKHFLSCFYLWQGKRGSLSTHIK